MHLNVLTHTKCDEEQLAIQFILSGARIKSWGHAHVLPKFGDRRHKALQPPLFFSQGLYAPKINIMSNKYKLNKNINIYNSIIIHKSTVGWKKIK